MAEKDVIAIMGRPNKEVRDQNNREFYMGSDKRCAVRTVRVLVYDHFLREGVFVALDDRSTVTCVLRGVVVITG